MAAAVGGLAIRASDRRLNPRYTIDLKLRYKLFRFGNVARTGEGRSLNLSSGGAMIECDTPLPKGCEVELTLAWPAVIDDHVALSLVVQGCTVRSVGTRTAIAFTRHAFRTRNLNVCASAVN